MSEVRSGTIRNNYGSVLYGSGHILILYIKQYYLFLSYLPSNLLRLSCAPWADYNITETIKEKKI